MEKFLDKLKESGFKLTRQRTEIIEVLHSARYPMTVRDIHNVCNYTDFASVYRNIELFNKAGLVRKVFTGDRIAGYELQYDSHKHKIICLKCGKIKEISICCVGQVQAETGFNISEHIIEFKGICPECAD